MLGHSRGGFTVSPLKKRYIYDSAAAVREVFRPLMGTSPYVPLDRVFELLPQLMPGFKFEVCEEHEMGADHGQTDPVRRLIRLRQDVYDGMCQGSGRDRFTAAHELGHLFLHADGPVFSRSGDGSTPIYMNSEWQADTFASAFLIDEKVLPSCTSIIGVQDTFGVSHAAAGVRFQK